MPTRRRGLVWGLILATLLAAALRLVRLGAVPVAVYCDEAFSAYEAWCLLLTGRDSRGVPFPFFFDIFGKGWGEPLHFYLSVPAVALFGLTPFAARLVAAMAGTLAVPMTGLMTRSLIRAGRPESDRLATRAGVAASVLMAVSPWAFHFSRIAFQASLLPLTLAGGFWLISRAMDEPGGRVRPIVLAAGAVVLGLSFYTYTVSRLAVPLLAAGFVVTHRRRLAGAPKAAAAAALLLALLAAPVLGFSMTERGRQRFSDVSVFSNPSTRDAGPVGMAASVAGNYLSYYTPRFLLTEGDPNPRHSIRGHGVLHPHDLLMLAAGVAACLLLARPGAMFLLWWLVSYPAAAALTIDPRHAVRAICGQPGVYAVAGFGAALLLEIHTTGAGARIRRLVSSLLLSVIIAVAGLSAVAYFHDYFVAYPVYSGPAWQYGLKEMYDYVDSVSTGHDSVYVTRNEDFPYIQYLFYRSFPPGEYQAHRLTRTRYLFDQEVFYKGPRIPHRMNPIFVWKPWEVQPGVEAHKTIAYPDGSPAFVIAW